MSKSETKQAPLPEPAEAEPPPPPKPEPCPALDDIMHVICERFGMTPDEIRSDWRRPSLVMARELAYVLARQHTLYSFCDIARAFRPPGSTGKAAHATVITAINRFERTRLEVTHGFDKTKAQLLEELDAKIKERKKR